MKRKAVFYGRRFGESAELDPNMWAVPYGDMMTNLMIFFLILFALTTIQQQALKISEDRMFVKKLEKFGKISLTADKIKVTFSQDIIFPKGSPDVSESFKGVLLDVSDYLKNNPGTVIVEGHSDSTPLRWGKYKDNWYLSAERGWSVASELIKNGIDPKRLQIRGCGEFNPVASNETETCRAKNRRIEMTILKIKTEETQRFIYYKTTGYENINDISKRFFASDKFLNQIRELNSGKIDDKDCVAKDTEILIPYQP
ncbi:MAG: OmpA family protein [Elusimicrobia bacterium]|nr:OmpA family protein [Elusimicrobiota bacterium]